MTVHVFCAVTQPATGWRDHYLPDSSIETSGWHPRHQIRCHDCGRRRWAANLSVQVYYDLFRVFCTDRLECDRARKARRT